MSEQFSFLEKEKLRIRFIELLVLSASILTAISSEVSETLGTSFLIFLVGVMLYYMVIFHASSREYFSIFAVMLIALGFSAVFILSMFDITTLDSGSALGYSIVLPLLISVVLLHEKYVEKIFSIVPKNLITS